jgi:hypothetical protein
MEHEEMEFLAKIVSDGTKILPKVVFFFFVEQSFFSR